MLVLEYHNLKIKKAMPYSERLGLHAGIIWIVDILNPLCHHNASTAIAATVFPLSVVLLIRLRIHCYYRFANKHKLTYKESQMEKFQFV